MTFVIVRKANYNFDSIGRFALKNHSFEIYNNGYSGTLNFKLCRSNLF